MSESPIEQLIDAIDKLDLERAMALVAPGVRFMAFDGRRAEGAGAVRVLLGSTFAMLRSTSHRITAQWHVDEAWIAEVDATYELRDWMLIKDLPRVYVVKTGPEGLTAVRVYGAHEHPLDEHRTGEEGMWVGGRLIPPL